MYKKICLFVCMFLLLPICVLAKDKMELNVDKTDITVGDEIIVTAKVSEELKSYAVIATLKYDENVFQKIEETNFDLEDADSTIISLELLIEVEVSRRMEFFLVFV